MKLLNTVALVAALSITASSAFAAAPTSTKSYSAIYGRSTLDFPTRITVTDNSGDPIIVGIEGTTYSWGVAPDGPDYVLTITGDVTGYTNLVITDTITGEYKEVPAYDHDDVNVHPGLEIGVSLKK